MNPSVLRVAVADDDTAVRDALVDLVCSRQELSLAGVAADHDQLISLVEDVHPDVVVMDVRMPAGEGTEVIRRLRTSAPDTALVALSALDDGQTVLAAVEAGAAGYLVKDGSERELLEAVARAHRGQFSITAALARESVSSIVRELDRCQHVERELRRSDNTLHQILDSSPNGVLLVGPSDRIRFANSKVDRLFGRAVSGLVDQPASTLLPERCQAAFLTLLARAQSEQQDGAVHEELVGVRNDGAEFDALMEARRVTLADGQYTGVFIRDLSDSPDLDVRYRRLVESSPDALLLIDRELRIELLNDETEHLFGYQRDELLGRSLELLLPGSPPDLFVPPTDSPPGEWAPADSTIELTGRCRDATEFPADVRLSLLEEQDRTFVVATVRNMSEARRQEQVLERSFQSLRDIDRTHHLLLSRLVRAQEDERKRISVGIHDDTLQAMTAASLRVQQLRRRLDDSADLDVVDKLEETIQLSISRLRRLMFELRPPASDQGGLGEALETYLEQLFNHGELVYTVHDELMTDLSQEAQVIAYRIAQEALTNVWLHADAKSVTVRLSDVDDGCLMVVEDDGVGYDPVDAEGKRDHLGLTLMQERAHIAGGWCRIESAPGEGTMVQFWLPHSPDAGTPEHGHPLLSGGD